MRKLLVDIGNTTIHLKLLDTKLNCYIFEKIFLTKKIIKLSVFPEITEKFDEMIYCSVVKEVENMINHKFPCAKNIMTFKKIKQSDFVYPLNLLGADFVANFYATNLENAVIVSLGTATTFMIIQDKKMIGAIIAPGMESSLQGLIKNAPALEFSFEDDAAWENQIINLQTIQAINKGVVNGHAFMVDGLINEIKSKYKISQVILTGGYAKYIKNSHHLTDNDLIFKGINIISQN